MLDPTYFNLIKLIISTAVLSYLLNILQIHSFLFISYYYCLNLELQNSLDYWNHLILAPLLQSSSL